MQKLFKNHRGVSMPIVIGLVVLLALASTAINQLIIRNLRSVQNIEASNRAYMAAEGAMEDALYELSSHKPGYETPSLKGTEGDPRHFDFRETVGVGPDWTSEVEIKSISGASSYSGQFFADQKLTIPLYQDTSGKNGANFIVTDPNEVSTVQPVAADFTALDPGNLTITFRIPAQIYKPNGIETDQAFSNGLIIDNDNDAWGENGIGINEDGIDDTGNCGVTGFVGEDADCDERENEDSEEDVVIFWKITDGQGNELRPLEGCLTDDGTVQPEGTEICEKDFIDVGGNLEVTLNEFTRGHDETTIGDFIDNADNASDNRQLQMEFIITSPMEQVDRIDKKKIGIPYLEYIVSSNSTTLPLPYFTINADGYFQDFKQSLTTRLTPESVLPIFEFTILQQ